MHRILRSGAPVVVISLSMLCSTHLLAAQGDGSRVFKANCTLCHSEDGSGTSPTGKALKAKDLRSEEVQKQTDEELAEVITKGRGKMPAFGAKFSPDVIKSLVAYIRQMPKK
jgi:cytochrome c6